MKAAGRMGAKRHAARAMNSAYNLANRWELGKAQIMLRRKNALEKVVHARAQAFINQVGQGAPAAAQTAASSATAAITVFLMPAL